MSKGEHPDADGDSAGNSAFDLAKLRLSLKLQRKSLTPERTREWSQAAAARFADAMNGLARFPQKVCLYHPLPGEPDPSFLEAVWEGRSLDRHYPRVADRAGGILEMAAVPAPGQAGPVEWRSGPYGILEPGLKYAATPAPEIDLIIVPALAVGERGERVGMGKGYYDRYLVEAPQALRVALAFDFQVQKQLPQQPWDQAVHWIVTETREIRLPALDAWWTRMALKKF